MKTKLTVLAVVPLFLLSACYYSNYERIASTDFYYPEPERTDTIVIIQPVPYPVPAYPNPPSTPTVPTKTRPVDNNRRTTEAAEKDSPSRTSQNNNTQRNSGGRSNSRSGR